MVARRLKEGGTFCKCIRCREVGHVPLNGEKLDESDVELKVTEYEASRVREVFLSFETKTTDTIVGYARLRLPSSVKSEAALLRELHVYGQMVPISEKAGTRWQHRGYGERLLAECETRADAFGFDELWVTSGVGARNYYRKFGYERKGPYMAKLV